MYTQSQNTRNILQVAIRISTNLTVLKNCGKMANRNDTLVLFDVDGTLSASRKKANPEMIKLVLENLKAKANIGIVSGSDLSKTSEQLGDNIINEYDYVFSENGTVAYHNGQLIARESIAKFLGEQKVGEFTSFCQVYMGKLELPIKRGNFIEHRNGLINLCPPGRTVSQQHRDEFGELDKEKHIRKDFVKALKEHFKGEKDLGLNYAIGGQISIDAFPHGWDKRFCLKYVEGKYKVIHFFGDQTAEGGNDHEIFNDPRTVGHTVQNPDDTMKQLKEIFDL